MIKAKVYEVKGIAVYVRTIASRLKTNITGAIDIRTTRMVTMISKMVDKNCVKEFLKRIRVKESESKNQRKTRKSRISRRYT